VSELRRRLAAVLHADVVGYSRMMEQAETRTLRELQRARREIWEPATRRHFGRLVSTAGDAMLIEFSSAIAAVACAVDLQRGTIARAAVVPETVRLRLRIGINFGDVVVQEDGDLFGEGVNLAQRLEGLAQADGIMVSAKVREEVSRKLPGVRFEDAGEHRVKNIARPLQAWRVAFSTDSAQEMPATPPPPAAQWLLASRSARGKALEHLLDTKALDSKDGLVIGRHSRYCSLVLNHDSISRRHARLSIAHERISIEDLGSTNGTFVDGQKITAYTAVPVRIGSHIRVGDQEFVLAKKQSRQPRFAAS
jgi:adenylate cyclase